MIHDCLKEFEWKKWIVLSDSQYAAVDCALKRACESTEIQEALRKDTERLLEGKGEIGTAENDLIRMYGEALFRMHPLLVLLGRLPWLQEQYRAHGIPDRVLLDTMSDVKIWLDVCEKQTGCIGLLEYGWLCFHFSFRLFRLGRLQFVAQGSDVPAVVYRHRESGVVVALCPDGDKYTESGEGAGFHGTSPDGAWTACIKEENGCAVGFPIHPRGQAIKDTVRLDLTEWEKVLEPGDPVLDMHIAEGCPLAPEAVVQSLAEAPGFFEKYLNRTGFKAFTCGSWLLDDNIGQIQPKGNIASFQKRFYLIPHAGADDWQTKQRAFGDPDVDILKVKPHTSLQKAICAWYKAGRKCRHCKGFILL